jgi:hypothetical protein
MSKKSSGYSTQHDQDMDTRSTTVILEQQEKKTQCCIHMIFASILLLVLIATATFVLLESNSDKLPYANDS